MSACRFVVLWATSAQFPLPQFVGAWSDGLHEAMREAFDERVEEAQTWFRDFGDDDGPWTFWTTHESISMPERPTEVVADARYEASVNASEATS